MYSLLLTVCSAVVFLSEKVVGLDMETLKASGDQIYCPSGNKVYVHPISGDLQQCTQQLGYYNRTTCPGGTVCERFPILIPGFQDYCCWGAEPDESESLVIGSHSSTTEMPFPEVIAGNVYNTLKPDDEWIEETTEAPRSKRTKRPRRLRLTTTPETTTVTTTTSAKPIPLRRGPSCRNPDDAPLIDFGNRLRDCYYQRCPFGYRCEFTPEIRRYICCGRERDILLPPGLPPLPAPKPLVPLPFRPRTPYFFNENEISEPVKYCKPGQEYHPTPALVTVCNPPPLPSVCPPSHPQCITSPSRGHYVCCSL
uniref:Chitin-binding type-2 domain-containing protein n=1 Tax=Syphacia muris TaxID=451379 RepID=A0A0N5A7W0_9BILA